MFGSKKANFLWDTGADVNGIDIGFLVCLGVNIEKANEVDAKMNVKFMDPNSELTTVFFSIPLAGRDDYPDMQGILGTPAFSGSLLIVDLQNQKIVLSDRELSSLFPGEKKYSFDFEMMGNVPVIEASIDGVKAKACLDTGYSGSLELLGAAIPYSREVAYRETVADIQDGRENALTEISVNKIETLGESFASSVVSFVKESGGFQMRIGTQFLKSGVLALDYRTGKGFWMKRSSVALAKNYMAALVDWDLKVMAVNVEYGENPFVFGDRILEIDGTTIDTRQFCESELRREGIKHIIVKRGTETLNFDCR